MTDIKNLQNNIIIDKKYIISTFWLNESNIYIYFLVFEEKNNSENKYFILIYKNVNYEQKVPIYTINLTNIYLFKSKSKIYITNNNESEKFNTDKDKKDLNIRGKKKSFSPLGGFTKTERANTEIIELNLKEEANLQKRKLSSKELQNDKIKKRDFIYNYYHYNLSPKDCLFDICQEKYIYFFIGRNLDNSIKIYEIYNNDKKLCEKSKYNIPIDSFVSCLYKKDNKIFFSGHKNGKLYEWEIKYNSDDKNKKKDISIKKIKIKRDLIAHKDSMICSINYIEKHNIIITSSNDGKLFIRKYFDFELLSVIKLEKTNSIISKIIYSDYDLLYLLINHKDKEYQNKSSINVYTLNGLLIESSSSIKNFVNIELLKNGKIICNNLNSNKFDIFGLNKKLGDFNEYDILSKIQNIENKSLRIVTNFIFNLKKNSFYILLDDNSLYRQELSEFEDLSCGVDKLPDPLPERNNNNQTNKKENIF